MIVEGLFLLKVHEKFSSIFISDLPCFFHQMHQNIYNKMIASILYYYQYSFVVDKNLIGLKLTLVDHISSLWRCPCIFSANNSILAKGFSAKKLSAILIAFRKCLIIIEAVQKYTGFLVVNINP